VLTESQRRLYARQLLVNELGAQGQERLCASAVALAPDADRGAAAVAVDYLRRAGVSLDAAGTLVHASTPEAVKRLAGDPLLEPCAAWLAGAWAAVETIKQSAGVGVRAELGAEWVLASEEF